MLNVVFTVITVVIVTILFHHDNDGRFVVVAGTAHNPQSISHSEEIQETWFDELNEQDKSVLIHAIAWKG